MRADEIMFKMSPILISDVGQADKVFTELHANFIPVINEQGSLLGIRNKECTDSDNILSYQFHCVFNDSKIEEMPSNVMRAVVLNRENAVIGIIESVPLAKRLADNLEEYRQHIGAIIDSGVNGFLVISLEGAVVLANKVVEQLLGLEREQIVGRQASTFIPEFSVEELLKINNGRLSQKFKTGNVTVLANFSLCYKEDQLSGVICILQDVSSVEKVFNELTTVKCLISELEATINSSYDGIFITDEVGTVLRLNKAYERITGIKAEEVVGKTMKKLVEEKYYDESVTLLVMENKKSVTINQTVRGNHRILVTGNPIFDEHGDLFRVVTNVRDVTELTNLQEQLHKTKEQTLKYQTELSHLRQMHMQDKSLVYRSQAMARIVEMARKIADVDSTVLINGESGTGKELVAKLIHQHGKGLGKPFIKINCAAIPAQLLESELFGYEGGAFTGAKKEGKPGLFELAHTGTLFLDEVGDLPALLQVKLLRALQEKEIIRVGGTQPKKVNVRIIAATHQDIAQMTKAGTFREDLYYRLMVVPVFLPPLRDRKEDIPLLIMHFLEKFNSKFGYSKKIAPPVIERLMHYSWPGNVRELENIIERMMVIAPGEDLGIDLLPENIYNKVFLPRRGAKLKAAVEQTEKYLLAESYKENHNWQKVAELLGINRATVFRKAAKYGLIKN